jgi:dienelactone hydrolase
MFRMLAAVTATFVVAACQAASAPQMGRSPSEPAVDAPELARLGAFAVGTTQDLFVLPPHALLSADGIASGRLAQLERRLAVRIWYPARVAPDAKPIRYVHSLRPPGAAEVTFSTAGIAVSEALPVVGARFPLVVVSHGFGGWSEAMSNLTENLASKGYVVVAIDHQDIPLGANINQQLAFGNVVLNRARDQREVIAALQRQVAGAAAYRGLIDARRIGLIGYSMGGFGALATAGAPYDPASGVMMMLPGQARPAVMETAPDVAANISALVTIAPWGGQPATRAWTSEALGRIKAPTLMIDGDSDDIVDYETGVRWIFDQLSVERRLLVYQGARHNVANNPMPEEVGPAFSALEYFAEPVWRTDRLNAINQHFITAFLDLHLKGDTSKAAYLDLSTPMAGDGRWAGAPAPGATAAEGQPGYWRGFQRRWALGLEFHARKHASAVP